MDTRKTTLIATIVIIALLAVGIGFAYTAYTQNGGNTSDISYITVTQQDGEGESKYTFTDDNTNNITFDTFNLETTEKIFYKLDSNNAVTTDTDDFPSYTFVDLGSVNLVASYVGDDETPSPLYVTIRASTGFVSNDTWVYFLTNKYTVTDHVTDDIEIYAYVNNATGTWVNGPDSCELVKSGAGTYTAKEIHLCYGYPTAIANVNFSDNPSDTDLRGYLRSNATPVELNNGSIIFKATEVDPEIEDTCVVTYCSDNTEQALKFVVLVEKGSTYTLFANNNTTLFDAPNGKVFGGWKDAQGADVTEPQEISADTSYYIKWVDPTP